MRANIEHKLELVDQFKGQNKQQTYLMINPTGQVPTITEGKYLVLGGYQVFLQYLSSSHKSIKDRLYPEEYKGEIDKHMMWFQSIMRVTTGKLIKSIVGHVKDGDKQPNPEDRKRDQEDFFKKVLPRLDHQLASKKYMCGEDITVIDLQYYNEIVTILQLLRFELVDSEFPHLAPWFNERMRKLPEMVELDGRLRRVVEENSL